MCGFKDWAITSKLHDGTRRSVLREDLVYRANNGETYTVPKGFETDLASIPRILWFVYPPSGLYKSAAVLHDFFCETDFLSRKAGDNIFLEAMSYSHVSKFARTVIYAAVRIYAILFRVK